MLQNGRSCSKNLHFKACLQSVWSSLSLSLPLCGLVVRRCRREGASHGRLTSWSQQVTGKRATDGRSVKPLAYTPTKTFNPLCDHDNWSFFPCDMLINWYDDNLNLGIWVKRMRLLKSSFNMRASSPKFLLLLNQARLSLDILVKANKWYKIAKSKKRQHITVTIACQENDSVELIRRHITANTENTEQRKTTPTYTTRKTTIRMLACPNTNRLLKCLPQNCWLKICSL